MSAQNLTMSAAGHPSLLTATRGELTKVTTLTSTYSGLVLAVAALVGLPAMMMTRGSVEPAGLGMGSGLALMIAMTVCAVLATGDLQHGTARLTRWADPTRWHGYVGKVITSALIGAVTGLVGGAGVLVLGIVAGVVDTVSVEVLRASLGQVPVFALGCALAAAVGLLIQRTGAAVATIIIWVQLVETMLPGVPRIGEQLREWLPFMNAFMFTVPDNFAAARPGLLALGYFAAFCAAVIGAAGAIVCRRDL